MKENERKLSFNLIEKQQKLVSLETALEKSNLVRSNWDKFEDHINRTSMSLFAQNQQKQSQISHQGSLVGFSPNNKESLPYNMSDSDWQNINIVNWHVIQVVKDELSNIRLRTANYCQSKKNDKNTPSYENALKKKIEDCLARENDLQNKIISLQEMQYMNESELKDRISQLQDQNRQKINQVSGDIHRFQIAVNGKDSKITELENRIKVKESDASSKEEFLNEIKSRLDSSESDNSRLELKVKKLDVQYKNMESAMGKLVACGEQRGKENLENTENMICMIQELVLAMSGNSLYMTGCPGNILRKHFDALGSDNKESIKKYFKKNSIKLKLFNLD